jgi:hypothetical protein
VAESKHHLEIEQVGPASQLNVGDRFVFTDGQDRRQHEVTQDLDSHLEFDGRPNKRLSKDVMVKRVGEHDPGEMTERAVAALTTAVRNLEGSGDVQRWAIDMSDVINRAAGSGMRDAILPLEKLQNQGAAVFSRIHQAHGKTAVEQLVPAIRKRWTADVAIVVEIVRGSLMENVRILVREVIRQCGDKFCLYTKHKVNGKRRKLGTHPSKESAERQEKAIHAHGG